MLLRTLRNHTMTCSRVLLALGIVLLTIPSYTDAAYVLVRLSYGSYGRIDVKNPRNSQWGTICDNGWDQDDAQVVCRQLGYSGGTARMGGYYKKGTHEPVWLSQVKCAGTEEYIGLCSFKGWDNTGCKHMDDAGVTCGPPLTTTTTKRPLFSNWYPSRPLTRSTVPPTPSQPLTQSTVPPTPSQPTLPSSALTTVPPLSLDLVTQDQ